MAENVVTLNAQGEEEVHENVSGVELKTESGGTATFIHDAEIKQADWSQEDSAQKDYIKNKPELARVATAGTYAALKDRLFGDVAVVLEETTLYFHSEDNLPHPASNVPDPPVMLLGEIYRVMWDGTEYLCECTDGVIIDGGLEMDGSLSLGNKSLLWGNGVAEDTGEPFYINWSEELLYLEANGTAQTHTVSITPVNSVQKLDKKYLPDGLATEEFVKAEIAKIEIPEGGSSSGGSSEEVILTEQTLSFTQSTLAECYQSDVEIPFVPPVGATFTVVWDGEEYTVDGFSDSGVICLGNASIAGSREDTGEPFLYAVLSPDTSENGFFVTLDESSSHTVAIYTVEDTPSGGVSSWNDLTDKPFGEETDKVEVFAEQTLEGFALDSQYNLFARSVMPVEVSLTLGETYTVHWDGKSYDCIAQDGSVVSPGAIALGNLSNFAGVGNGEPFALGVMFLRDGDEEFSALAILVLDPTDTSTSHTLAISKDGVVVKLLDRKYLPGPPEFDLTAMGLPALTMDGTTVSVSAIDVSDLMAAFGKGPVKLTFEVDSGTGTIGMQPILCATLSAGYYNACFLTVSNNIPFLFSITAGSAAGTGVLYGQAMRLTTT